MTGEYTSQVTPYRPPCGGSVNGSVSRDANVTFPSGLAFRYEVSLDFVAKLNFVAKSMAVSARTAPSVKLQMNLVGLSVITSYKAGEPSFRSSSEISDTPPPGFHLATHVLLQVTGPSAITSEEWREPSGWRVASRSRGCRSNSRNC
jgi:hypothetical protein